ncbi:MAG TPA: lysylphosphatidylglycerol synthase transmembrane domain-containing protein [Ktedonobacterales bacterium]
MKQRLRALLNPKVIVPTVLSAGFLAFIVAFGDAGKVSREIATAAPIAVLPVFFLTVLYLLAKGVQWHVYLRRLEIKPASKEFLVPYAGGEFSNSLPLGVYLENYLLKGALGEGFGKSAAATTWMLITEILICLLALMVIGVPDWPWVRPLAIGIFLGMLAVGIVLFKTRLVHERLERWQPKRKGLRSAREGFKDFLEGSSQLLSWHTFVYGLPLTTIYLGAYATSLYVIGAALQASTWGWEKATAAYAFSLVVVLLVPVLPHLGTVEASGLGVMLQYGLLRNQAVGSFLTLRLLTTGTIFLVCGSVLLVLHRQVGQIFRRLSRGKKPRGQPGAEPEPE